MRFNDVLKWRWGSSGHLEGADGEDAKCLGLGQSQSRSGDEDSVVVVWK